MATERRKPHFITVTDKEVKDYDIKYLFNPPLSVIYSEDFRKLRKRRASVGDSLYRGGHWYKKIMYEALLPYTNREYFADNNSYKISHAVAMAGLRDAISDFRFYGADEIEWKNIKEFYEKEKNESPDTVYEICFSSDT